MCIFPLFVRCVRVTQFVSGLLSEGIVSLVAVELVSLWAEVNSGSSLVAMLNQASFALKETLSFHRFLCCP